MTDRLASSVLVVALSLEGVAVGEPAPAGAAHLSPADFVRARENIARHDWARRNLESRRSSCDPLTALAPEEIGRRLRRETPYVSVLCPTCAVDLYYRTKFVGTDRIQCNGCNTEYTYDPESKTNTRDVNGRIRAANVFSLMLRLETLGELFQLTGEERYARTAATILRRFADVFPGYKWHDLTRDHDEQVVIAGKMHDWYYHDAAYLAQAALAYQYIRDTDLLDQADRAAVRERLIVAGLQLATAPVNPCIRPSASGIVWVDNDKASVATSVLTMAAVLGATEPAEIALEKLALMLEHGFLADNGWWEGSLSYTTMFLHGMARIPFILRNLAPTEATRALSRKMEAVFHNPLRLTLPNLNLIPNNDSHVEDRIHRRILETAWYAYGDKDALAYLRELDPEFHVYAPRALFSDVPGPGTGGDERFPALTSLLLPDTGWGILRSDQPRDQQTVVMLDWGNLVGSHSHHDRLSVYLFSHGIEMLTDLGYKDSKHPARPWLACSLSHNTVVLGERLADSAQRSTRGKLLLSIDTPRVKAVAASGVAQVTGAEVFERTIILVGAANGPQYVLDYFVAESKETKDYVLLANAREASPSVPMESDWNVYDGLKLGDPTVIGWSAANTFDSYQFQEHGFLWDVTSAELEQALTLDWQLDTERRDVGFRTHVIPLGDPLKAGLGTCHGTRVFRQPDEGRHIPLFLARSGAGKTIFLSIHEPHAGTPFITAVGRSQCAGGWVITVTGTNGMRDRWLIRARDADRVDAGNQGRARAQVAFALERPDWQANGFLHGESAAMGADRLAVEQTGKAGYAIRQRSNGAAWESAASGSVSYSNIREVPTGE